MKKIIWLSCLFLLIGCSPKNKEAVVLETPTSTPTLTLTPEPTPIIDTNIYNFYTDSEYRLPESPQSLDDVDFNEKIFNFICPIGMFFEFNEEGVYIDPNECCISLTLGLHSLNGINHIRFGVDSTPSIFFEGVFKKENEDLYSFYGYKFTQEDIINLEDGYGPGPNVVYDKNYIKYFKYQDGSIYVYPDKVKSSERESYQFEKNHGCILIYIFDNWHEKDGK